MKGIIKGALTNDNTFLCIIHKCKQQGHLNQRIRCWAISRKMVHWPTKGQQLHLSSASLEKSCLVSSGVCLIACWRYYISQNASEHRGAIQEEGQSVFLNGLFPLCNTKTYILWCLKAPPPRSHTKNCCWLRIVIPSGSFAQPWLPKYVLFYI